jgi:hypothetical protein
MDAKGRDHMGCVGTNGRIILRWILGKYCVRMWIGFMRVGVMNVFD